VPSMIMRSHPEKFGMSADGLLYPQARDWRSRIGP
jgi:hypothetical protein